MGPHADGCRRPSSGSAADSQTEGGSSHAGEPATTSTIEVRRATEADADIAAALHARGISEGFLSLLGPGFLRLLYRRIHRHADSFLLMADHQGATVGFIAGSTDVAGLYRSFLWRDGIAAAGHSLGPLVRGWRRVFETLRHGSSSGSGTAPGAELLSVAVDSAWQGRGVARLLVASFLDEVTARGCQAAHVVVGAGNEPAVRLYEGARFVTTDHFELHPGTESVLMVWETAEPMSPPEAVTR